MIKTLIKNKDVMMEEIRKFVSEGKTVTLTVKGYSMNPFLRNMTDTITLGGWEDSQIKRGCVALVRDIYGNYLIHRIIKREGNLVTLMGDGNVGQIEKARLDDVIAIMYSICRGKRVYTADSFIWKVYSRFWMFFTPVKRYPLAIWRRLHRQPPL